MMLVCPAHPCPPGLGKQKQRTSGWLVVGGPHAAAPWWERQPRVLGSWLGLSRWFLLPTHFLQVTEPVPARCSTRGTQMQRKSLSCPWKVRGSCPQPSGLHMPLLCSALLLPLPAWWPLLQSGLWNEFHSCGARIAQFLGPLPLTLCWHTDLS